MRIKKGRSSGKIFNGEARETRIGEIMDALRDWRSSPFEHEGTMRAGLRSALCMKGHGWNKADLEAEGLINEAFHRLGAKRPTWDQAQAWYTTPRENCLWCFMDLPEEAYSGTRKDRFCSEVCARSALEHRQFERHYQQTEIGNSAYRIISRSRTELRACAHCLTSFHPAALGGNGAKQIYCSVKCRNDARRIVPVRNCKQCGRSFQPDRRDRLFCSNECKYEHGSTKVYDHKCEFCFKAFSSKAANARYCGAYCREKMARLVSGRWQPKELTPIVFDYMFKQAA